MAAPPPPTSKRPGKKDVQVVRAMFAYAPQNPDELGFEEGDILYVLNKDDVGCCWSEVAIGENTAQIDNPLHEASKRGNLSFVEELLAAGVSVNGKPQLFCKWYDSSI
eukprot:jgi/Hompol1/4418/HPOL_001739-RA